MFGAANRQRDGTLKEADCITSRLACSYSRILKLGDLRRCLATGFTHHFVMLQPQHVWVFDRAFAQHKVEHNIEVGGAAALLQANILALVRKSCVAEQLEFRSKGNVA